MHFLCCAYFKNSIIPFLNDHYSLFSCRISEIFLFNFSSNFNIVIELRVVFLHIVKESHLHHIYYCISINHILKEEYKLSYKKLRTSKVYLVIRSYL